MSKDCEYVGSADGATEDRLGSRAMAAYWRTEQVPQQPSEPDLYRVEGRLHVVLANGGGILAVYRVKNDGALRRLKRIPKCLIAAVES